MKFEQYLTFDCDSTYSVSQVSYSSGTLKIEADYTEDMESRMCNLTLAYDQTLVEIQNNTLSFKAKSDNYPLVISEKI